MKSIKLKSAGLVVLLALFFSACKQPQVIDPDAEITLKYTNQVDGSDIQFGVRKYTNAGGNSYQVDMLKYYISNVILFDTKGGSVTVPDYFLVDGKKADQQSFTINKVPNGTYNKIRFYMGVDPVRNHTGAQDGFLDPSYGMIWTWNLGYIFMKHEGQFLDASSNPAAISHHLGLDQYLPQIEVALPNIEVKGEDKILNLNFNLNQVYQNPHTIDFNSDKIRHSTGADTTFARKMKENLGDAFSFGSFN